MNDTTIAMNDVPAVTPGNGQPAAADAAKAETFASYDEWLAKQNGDVQKLVTENVTKLKSALEAERQERRQLAKQLNELTGKAEKGSELAKQLEIMQSKLQEQERRADFFTEASKSQIANAKLAFIAAQNDGLFEEFTDHRNGKLNYAALLEEVGKRYPELLKPPAAAKTNGGAGLSNVPKQPQNINELLRQMVAKK